MAQFNFDIFKKNPHFSGTKVSKISQDYIDFVNKHQSTAFALNRESFFRVFKFFEEAPKDKIWEYLDINEKTIRIKKNI